MSLEKCLQEITDEDMALSHASLAYLSHLAGPELEMFKRVWHQASPQRRAQIVERMVAMAEDNVHLDFLETLKLALEDPDEVVQERAIPGLWEVDDWTVIPLLLDILKSDRSCSVRSSSAIALGKFARLSQEGKLLAKYASRVEEVLMEVLQNEVEPLEVRRRALEAVSYFSTPSIHEYIRWAYNSQDANLKCSSLYAMGKTEEMAWLPAIITELKSSTAALRYEAVCACGDLGEEDMAPHLIPLLEDDDREVQVAAIDALGKIGGTLATRVLRRCLRNGDEAVRDAAHDALEEMELDI